MVQSKTINIEGEFFKTISVTIPAANWIEWKTQVKTGSLKEVSVDLLRKKMESPVDMIPLRKLAGSKKKCVILVDDPSRPTPTRLIVPLIIEEIKAAGIKAENILLFVAKGTHKTFSDDRLREKLGDLVDQYTVIQNESDINADYKKIGHFKSGRELSVHKAVLECDLKIGVGQIILSPFAGFTGGPKIILPGASNNKTIFQNHFMAFHPDARVGEVVKNPVRVDMNEAARMIGLDCIFNVTVNQKNQVVFAAFGNPEAVFKHGVDTMLAEHSLRTHKPLDLVLYNTYPSDRSLYYTISKADIGELAVKKGGTVLVIGSCREGIGSEEFYSLLDKTPEDIKAMADKGLLRADWAGVSYRLVRILQEKRIVVFVPEHIRAAVSVKNENLVFCSDPADYMSNFLQENQDARVGYISSQFALPVIE